MIYQSVELFRPVRMLCGQSMAVEGWLMVWRQIRHGLLSRLSLWCIRNTHSTLNQAYYDYVWSNSYQFCLNTYFSQADLQHLSTVRINELGTAKITVLAGISSLEPTPWYPFMNDGIQTPGWIIHPFYTIHLRSYLIFYYSVFLLPPTYLKQVELSYSEQSWVKLNESCG